MASCCFIIPGLLDFVSIALIGRLTGSLVGGRLGNIVEASGFFGVNLNRPCGLLDFSFQSFGSMIRIYLRVAGRTTSAMWLDLSERILRALSISHMSFILQTTFKLSADLLSSLECLLVQIITPVLRAFVKSL